MIEILMADMAGSTEVSTLGHVEFSTIFSAHSINERTLMIGSTDGRKVIVGDGQVEGVWERALAHDDCMPVMADSASMFVLCKSVEDGRMFVLSEDGPERPTDFMRGSVAAFDAKRDVAYIIVDRLDSARSSITHDLFALRLSDQKYNLVMEDVRPFKGVWLPEQPGEQRSKRNPNEANRDSGL